jgi:hypothetical protein
MAAPRGGQWPLIALSEPVAVLPSGIAPSHQAAFAAAVQSATNFGLDGGDKVRAQRLSL